MHIFTRPYDVNRNSEDASKQSPINLPEERRDSSSYDEYDDELGDSDDETTEKEAKLNTAKDTEHTSNEEDEMP